MDRSGPTPIRVFESGAILMYLAREVRRLPADRTPAQRAECLSWLFWQMGSAPYLGGGFGHFYAYAPTKIEYAIDRFAMEVKRQLDVLDRRLAESEYLAGDEYTIADIAVWPWYGALAKGWLYEAGEFLQVAEYKNVQRWTDLLLRDRPFSADAWSIARSGIRRTSCTSVTTLPISSRCERALSAGRAQFSPQVALRADGCLEASGLRHPPPHGGCRPGVVRRRRGLCGVPRRDVSGRLARPMARLKSAHRPAASGRCGRAAAP